MRLTPHAQVLVAATLFLSGLAGCANRPEPPRDEQPAEPNVVLTEPAPPREVGTRPREAVYPSGANTKAPEPVYPPGLPDEGPPPDPEVRLGKLPDVKLLPRPPVDEAQARRIKALIADLARLDSPDFGLSPTLSGSNFAPVAGQERGHGGLITDHQLQQSTTLKELVALGPAALPFLLDALDDRTPTKLVIDHSSPIGSMWYSSYLQSINPVNRAEAAVYKERKSSPPKSPEDGKNLSSHTVTIGDVCFVVIGQIVGREYEAVRYFPTACIILSSPTQDARLCTDVRAMWGGKDPAKKLFDSLLADYATVGIPRNDDLPYGWSTASRLQEGAALRLLYYFPTESAALIAARLEKLHVAERRPDAGDDHYAINDLETEEFIKAVAWCKEPAIRTALTAIFKRATDRDILLAALRGVEDKELILKRMASLIDTPPADGDGEWLDGLRLLKALAGQPRDAAKPVMDYFLRGNNPDRCRAVCVVFEEYLHVPWDVDVLGPLLNDRREVGPTYPVDPGKPELTLRYRVCDWAADALVARHPELKFEVTGTHANLDKQIAVIREQLNRKK